MQHPVDDPNYIIIDLDFTTTEKAQRFLAFLKKNVWSSADNAPALAGTPQTKLLQNQRKLDNRPAFAAARAMNRFGTPRVELVIGNHEGAQ